MSNIDRLLAIMARLRDPEAGCPWDLEQSFRTIAPHTIEEAYEVADAIERADMDDLREELGDLLFQVVFYAQMGREQGAFDFEAIAGTIADKMIRRHPHVFGEDRVDDAAQMVGRWESQKAAERDDRAAAQGRRASVLDGVIGALPALTRAVKLQKRAARVGFDWTEAADILDKIEEEVLELRAELAGRDRARMEDELGDLLFALANLARRLDIDPEAALRGTNAKFERRFRRIEELLHLQGRSAEAAGLDEMEALWQQAKTEER
ncbi:nucleoside triphosphate pyrophosphohydrolase [Arenibaculum sp.]|jgi:ATP diphosphatase|uniref:nucleoside triphosphate pyrophosphohydrolase n=1 Tax=Arenibaculum sp. TaxID=2865862 RepID=UPI002E0E2117|nr:nucleoside triphosphate pyrophosphohydrolase [Arenibaculum sp.]